ncbi:PTS system glucitol/sorbitol-specific IIA component [Neobacillus niacini]|jgi:glucitol/sorbitol PTS system EIIA component|uniref:PTS glucitol/sorbitol transporter subunit IIA n=1 Tax=Neobacillus niacini TaxID=86668 RepID=UPI002788CCF6|nr:PTS glucitol/sorbitol transporter subunit IIA [Neobacillus niacini]MDQ1004437.1 PTS system glucitol/sorbitol-specific IIA component [Neobacillus niacini]
MKTIYQSTVTEVGSQVELFLQEKMIVLFNESAPSDLREIAVIHQYCPLEDDITVGDELVIGDQSFKITSVGHKVNETMRELGHSTVSFNGSLESDLPGTLCVEDKEVPNITVSSKIMFRKLSMGI